jgi:hypothetical protein
MLCNNDRGAAPLGIKETDTSQHPATTAPLSYNAWVDKKVLRKLGFAAYILVMALIGYVLGSAWAIIRLG